jgi:hypothetical protein
MKYLMFVCLVSFAVVSLSACSDSGSSTATPTAASGTAMQPDTKDMKK